MKKRHTVLLLLAGLGALMFLDRQAVAVAGPRIQAEFNIPPHYWGWIMGIFVVSYGLFAIPVGAMGDRIGPRRTLTWIALWTSVVICFMNTVTGFAGLLVVQGLFGAGEAGAYPNMSGAIARWCPARERARAQGVTWGASRLGGALAPLVLVPIQAAFGWRIAFIGFGVIGSLWASIWWLWFRDNYRDQPGISREEIEEIDTGRRTVANVEAPVGLLFRSRQFWLIVVMYFFYAWGSWFYFSWFPTFLVRGVGLTEAQMGIIAPLPFLLGMCGNLVGGVISDRLVSRWGLRAGRRLVGATSLAVTAFLLAGMGFYHNRTVVVVLATLGFGIMDLMLPSAWALCLDIGGQSAGLVSAAMNTAGQCGGTACAVLFGYIVTATGSYFKPLFVVAGMLLISAALFAAIDPTRPIVARKLAEVHA